MSLMITPTNPAAISLSAGQSIVVKDMSGASLLSPASLVREDASARIGAGFFVYGPATADGPFTLSTTGQSFYNIVNGDPTPADQPVLLDPAGSTLSGSSAVAVRRAALASDQIVCAMAGCSQENAYQSGTYQYNMHWLNEWNAVHGHPMNIVAEYGVDGAQIEAFSPYIDQALAIAGLQVLFVGAPTNNIVRELPAAGTSASYSVARAKEYGARGSAKGVVCVFIAVDGGDTVINTGSYTWTLAKEQQAAIYNDEMRKYCADSGHVFLDLQPAVRDKTTATIQNIVGAKVDELHDAPGGAWLKSDFIDDTGALNKLLAAFPSLRSAVVVVPNRDKWSGIAATPVNLFDNVGFLNPTGGNSDELTPATITAFSANVDISATDPFIDTGTSIYYVPGGKVGGYAVAPSHTGYLQNVNGAVYLFPNTNRVPQGWGFKRSGVGPTARCNVVWNPDAKPLPRFELVVLMKFTARSQTLALSGGEFITNFLQRFVDGAMYELYVNLGLIAHSGIDGATPSGLNQMPLMIARPGGGPLDGAINAVGYDRDFNNKTTMQLGRFPKKWNRWIRPYQHTASSSFVTAYAPQVRSAGAGWVLFTLGGDYLWRRKDQTA